jgi:hypothetical protein
MKFEIMVSPIHLYVHGLSVSPSGLSDLRREVANIAASILDMKEKIVATIDQLAQDVSDESTLIESVATLITGLRQQILDALSGATLPEAVQAKVNAVFATAESNKARLTSALATGTAAEDVPIDQPASSEGQ